MKTIDWLLSCDPAIGYLSRRDLLEEKQSSRYSPHEGWIKRLYEHVDPTTHLWAGGVYSPKYNSTHYTLHTLWSLQANPNHEAFQRGVDLLLKHLWPPKGEVRKHHYQDLCVSAMVCMLAVYAGKKDPRIHEIIDYILAHKMPDGAFNCAWQRKPQPTMGSLHTTLLVLEMIHSLKEEQFEYRMDELLACIPDCVEFILDRHLFKKRTNGEVIDRNMIRQLFPLGWRYTVIRALDCFAKMKIPYDTRMEEGFLMLENKADSYGRMKTEAPFSGQYFFRFESLRDYSGFNTLRFLRIMKHYRQPAYLQCMNQKIAT